MTYRAEHLVGLTSAFGKDLQKEELFAEINRLLAPVQKTLEARKSQGPGLSTIFVLGPPRGGTTLVSQLLAATGLFGIVTNLAARFWNAPALGLKISQALKCETPFEAPSYVSKRGVTSIWFEPSEFGYFWSRFFDLGQLTHVLGPRERQRFDRDGLRRAVASMEVVCEQPMAFKNNTWFTFHADLLAKAFPDCVLVVCRRDPVFVAQSLWRQRIDLYGDAACWWSVRPPNYDEIVALPPIQQVAHQALSINAEMERSLSQTDRSQIIYADYDRVVSEPRQIIAEISAAAGVDSSKIESALEMIPDKFDSTDVTRIDLETFRQLRNAVAAASITYKTTTSQLAASSQRY